MPDNISVTGSLLQLHWRNDLPKIIWESHLNFYVLPLIYFYCTFLPKSSKTWFWKKKFCLNLDNNTFCIFWLHWHKTIHIIKNECRVNLSTTPCVCILVEIQMASINNIKIVTPSETILFYLKTNATRLCYFITN